MLISFNWLKQYIDLPDSVTADEVARNLTMSTVEVEGVHHKGKHLENIVVGKVVACEKHPNADKLKVCTVDVGTEKLQIVCGGSNVHEDMLCAVAKLGAKVRWHGEGEPVEMKEAEIRGVKSFGMICASTEIGLGEMFPLKEEKEILDLSATTPHPLLRKEGTVGQPLADVLGLNDAVLEIDNKSMTNRPDLWGHYGMAREVAAVFKKDLKKYEAPEIKSGDEIKIKVKVEDEKLCPRYMAVAISGVKVGPSPDWLAQKIHAIGLRPINNIVDITNYVMYDLGEPMHAFDADRLRATDNRLRSNRAVVSSPLTIVIRRAPDGEKFKTLDGNEHKLDSSMLVIANEEKPVALAGIMGGEESGITNATTAIVFEAANFDATAIRKSAIKLGLRTDSSARFEKALDPNLCAQAIAKATELTLQLCPGARVASKVVDEKKFHLYQGPIELSWEFLNKKIGVEIDRKEVTAILERLGFGVKEKKDVLLVTVPTWRATKDISIPEDLVEEVARIYGYNNIPVQLPVFPIIPPERDALLELENKTRAVMSGELGYSEACNYSFVSGKQIKNLGDDISKYIELDNPLSKDRPYLRRNLLPNLLGNVKDNLENFSEVKIFEIGQVFRLNDAGARALPNGDELLPGQDTWFTAVYASKKDQSPYWRARRALETLLAGLGYEWEVAQKSNKARPWEHDGRLFVLSSGGKIGGAAHELNPATAKNYGIEARVAVASLRLNALAEHGKKLSTAHIAQPAHPEVKRDLAFVVKKSVTHAEILSALRKIDTLLKKVELFDVYEGATIGEQYKSMAYRFIFSNSERTLKSEEVDKVMEKVINAIEKLGGEVRG